MKGRRAVGVKERRGFGVERLRALRTADFFTPNHFPKVTEAAPMAVLFLEQVTMNNSIHRERYLCVQAVSHEMT